MIAGRYSLDREVGRGGMGAVWLGRDEVLGREVALKRIGLLPGADSTDLARAEREARLTARLNHPHVVSVFNLVVDPDTGAHWLVMEYVDGVDLGRLVRERGRLSPEEAAPLLWQAADALVAAHAAGIVHRDVKPSNILVDRSLRAKLSDFGIARIAGDPALTQTGLVIGSPAYLAPEVAAGQRGDEGADVWSLGATLFYALAGRPPYDIGDHVLGGLYRIVNEEPPRLADAGSMTPLLEATMVRDPSRRWSMTEVRDFLAGPVGADRRVPPVEAPHDDGSATRRLEAVPPTAPAGQPAPRPDAGPPSSPPSHRPPPPAPTGSSATASRRRRGPLIGLALLLVLAVAVALFALLRDRDPAQTSATPSETPSATPSATSSSPSPSPSPARPTAQGMSSFVRGYVAAVASDPDTAWTMLTPKFQQESGGLATYRRFWGPVGSGEVLSISPNPRTLVVSYRARFENFGTGRRPTVLQLVFRGGRYLIDGELTSGS